MEKSAEQCLEDALQTWEDQCLNLECMSRWSEYARQVPRAELERFRMWRKFRRTVLNQNVMELEWEDWILDLSHPHFEIMRRCYDMLALFPLEFFEWSRMSRRVFSIPQEEQYLFEIATMPDIRWRDVTWPFASYMIELATPILLVESDTEYWCSHVLVSRLGAKEDDKQHAIRIRLLTNRGARPFYTHKQRKTVLAALKDDDEVRVMQVMQSSFAGLLDDNLMQGTLEFYLFDTRSDSPDSLVHLEDESLARRLQTPHASDFNRFLVEMGPGAQEGLMRVTRIVVGFCLWLDSLGPSPRLMWQRRKPGRTYAGAPGIITQEINICKIIGRGVIDPARYSASAKKLKGQGFVRPHWRRQHWKRPAYTPPEHPKTIRVPAKLINEDLVPYFGILAGSITRVLSGE